MAPVAGGVAHGQQHRDVAAPRLGERLLTPLPPVDRVVGVLAQVRAGAVCESVGHHLTVCRQAGSRAWSTVRAVVTSSAVSGPPAASAHRALRTIRNRL